MAQDAHHSKFLATDRRQCLIPTPSDIVPFRITVCGIDELGDHCEVGVSHVLSILDPSAPELPVFGSFGEHERIELRFDDVIEESSDHVVPNRRDVEEILTFGRSLRAEQLSNVHLLVHCHAGVSRSTAAMTLILAQARPDLSADEILAEVLRIRSRAWPNLRIIELGDILLGRNGAIVSAVSRLYRERLRVQPQLERDRRENGRGREVEMAMSGDPS
jgi:predicted protein tyrosine phosphatase